MNRLKIIREAKKAAYQAIDDSATLSKEYFEKLKRTHKKKDAIVKVLSRDFILEAASWLE